MLAPVTRCMTLTLGLCAYGYSTFSGATNPDPMPDEALELSATDVVDTWLGSTTENSGSYTTGSMSTATRLDLSIQETPQSVSVVTRQQLDDFQLDSLSEALGRVTGVTVQRNDSERPTYYSRGYAINNFQIDGMLNTFSGLKSDSDTIIYDRIEVVRGATGLTTGAGDPSGTVAMVRKRPTHQLAVKTGLSAGSYDNYHGYVDVGGPLGWDGRLRGRTVLAYRDSNSYLDRYSHQREVAYGVLEADLTDDTVLSVGYDYQNKHVQGSSWGTVPYWNADGSKAKLPRSTNLTASWSSWPLKDQTLFATLEHRLPHDWTMKAAFTHRRSDTDGKMYYGGNGFPEADGSGMSAWYSHFSSEERMQAVDLNLAGPYEAFGRQHDFMLGYGVSQRRNRSPVFTDENTPEDYAKIPDWRHIGVPKFTDRRTDLDASRGDLRQRAGYLATRLNPTDRLHIVLGSRYGSWESTSKTWVYDDNLKLIRSSYSRQKQSDQWTPYAGVLYDLTSSLTAYISYADIFNPQTYKDVDDKFLEPIVGKVYEVGLKASLFEERANLTTAVFYSKQDNVAEVDDSVPRGPNGEEYYTNSGKGTVVQGVEVELAGEVRPNWEVSLGYSYSHATRGDNTRKDPHQPLNLVRLASTHRLDRQWTVGGTFDWQSDVHAIGRRPIGRDEKGNIITTPARMSQGAVALVGLMARYQVNEHLAATLNVKNLLDQHYYNRMGFYNGVNYGDPRTVSLSLDWRL